MPLFYSTYIYMSESVLGMRIRIQKASEYGSNTDPDPQHCYLGMHRMRISGVVIISNIFLSEGQTCTGILSKRKYVYRFMEGHSDS